MLDLNVPAVGFATNIRTINDRAIKRPLPPPPTAPESSEPNLRNPDPDSSEPTVSSAQQRRLWWLVSVILVICGSNALALRALGVEVVIHSLFIGGTVAALVTVLWMGWMAGIRRASVAAAMFPWLIISAGVCSSILYFGVFSPALMVAVFAVFFVATREERVVPVAVYLTVGVFHAALVVVVVGGGLPDPGVLQFAEADLGKLVAIEVFLQFVLFATLVAGCAVRRGMARNLRTLEQQARSIGHHEMLLEDAKRAFETSLRAAGGGRFSHQILGSYRLGRLLGEGSMGEVYDATDTRGGAKAAVKVLRREVMGDRRIVQRFLNEARIVASLHTDHIVRVLETADSSLGLPYIAMERLYGHDLWNHIKAREIGRLSLAEVDELLRQIARGIDAAHRAGIIHRDLNPSNLFREDTGTWKILDFGVSKVIGERTVDNAIVGTPNFMSPEQAKGGPVDGLSDIFALGAIVYYAITGKLAFQGKTLVASAFEVTHCVPLAPSDLVSRLPPAIDQVVMTALAKEPHKRFATATAFSEAFSRAIAVPISVKTARCAERPQP